MKNGTLSITGTSSAIRWTEASGSETITCILARECPFTIIANDRKIVTLFASPLALKELTIGYLFTSGFIRSASQISDWQYDPVGCQATMTVTPASDARNDSPDSSMSLDASVVRAASRWIAECSVVFRESGGVHAAGLYDPRTGPLFFYEDVARHNAVDKVIGKALMDELDMAQVFMIRTGRTSLEIAEKAHAAGILILIARGAPTLQALEFAQYAGMTLLGFARTDEFTMYTHPQRLRL